MTRLANLLGRGRLAPQHRPWRSATLDVVGWSAAINLLADGHCDLLGLWGERNAVRLALRDRRSGEAAVVALDCERPRYPSVAAHHPPALRLERALRDLWGLEPDGLPDRRPWLDHGRWGVRYPLGTSTPVESKGEAYKFLESEGEGLHQIPVGPVHAGIIEPGHFRFTANGETVVRLEERLGYVHKGTEGLMNRSDIARGARLAGRVSGDSTVAYALAFSRATEAALSIDVPRRAHWLRALLAELERLANHFGDIGAICNDASFSMMHAHCGILRERVLRTGETCTGHRLMRDHIVPGGVKADVDTEGLQEAKGLVKHIRESFPALIELYDNTASLQDRTVGTGILKLELAQQYAAGGYVGRASSRNFDARRDLTYPPYDELQFDVPVLSEGDVNARVWIRIQEVEQCLSIIEQILERMPAGPVRLAEPIGGSMGEGVAAVEGFRGDILVWLRIGGDGLIERCHLRDPSWFQWPLLEAAIEGNIVADFPLCNKSFNCSYSGHDL